MERKKDSNYEFMISMNPGCDGRRFIICKQIFSHVESSSSFPLGSTYCHQKFIMPKSSLFIQIFRFIQLVQSNERNWGSHRLRFFFLPFAVALSELIFFALKILRPRQLSLRGWPLIKFNENRIKTKTHSHKRRDRQKTCIKISWKTFSIANDFN